MALSSLAFRLAASADLPAIDALVQRAYRGDESRAGWTTEAELLAGQRTDLAELQALVDDAKVRLVLGSLAGSLVSSLVVRDCGEHACYLGMFAVAPESQARGVGRAMLDEAERVARDAFAARSMRMTVIGQRAELIAWYVRRGYALTGERAAFPYGDARFGLPKRTDLYFEVLEKRLA